MFRNDISGDSIPTLSFDEYSSLDYSTESSFYLDDTYDLDMYELVNKLLEEPVIDEYEIDWSDAQIIFGAY